MRRLWDSLAMLLLSALALYFVFSMIKPYAIYIVVAIPLMFFGMRIYNRQRRW